MPSRIQVDGEVCIAAEMCVGTFPDAFALTEAGVAEVLPGVRELADDELADLVAQCPSGALRLVAGP